MPERRDLARQLGRGIEVGERRERRRVGVVVGGDVHGLQRGDRLPLGGGDALLQLAHLVGQRRLVAHGRGHAAQKGGDLGAGLDEAEDVVDEEQHVLVLHVAEVLGHGQRGQGDPQPDPRGLVHLAVDEGGLVDDARLLHLQPHVGALAGALPHAGEDRDTTVLLGHAVDHLLDDDGLAHAGPAEEADLSTLHVRLEEVDHLDPGLEHLGPRLELVEGRRAAVDLPVVVDTLDGVGVQRLAEHVEHVAEHGVPHRHGDPPAQVAHRGAPDEAVGLLHADAAHPAVADLLRHLGGDLRRGALQLDGELDGVVDLGQGVRRELHVDDGAGDGDDPSVFECAGRDGVLRCGGGHCGQAPFDWRSASAPPTISMISVVMES